MVINRVERCVGRYGDKDAIWFVMKWYSMADVRIGLGMRTGRIIGGFVGWVCLLVHNVLRMMTGSTITGSQKEESNVFQSRAL